MYTCTAPSVCGLLTSRPLAAGQEPGLLSALSQDLPPLAPFHAQAQALLPAMPAPVPERTFSDFLQDINWADPRIDDWPAHAGCPAGQYFGPQSRP